MIKGNLTGGPRTIPSHQPEQWEVTKLLKRRSRYEGTSNMSASMPNSLGTTTTIDLERRNEEIHRALLSLNRIRAGRGPLPASHSLPQMAAPLTSSVHPIAPLASGSSTTPSPAANVLTQSVLHSASVLPRTLPLSTGIFTQRDRLLIEEALREQEMSNMITQQMLRQEILRRQILEKAIAEKRTTELLRQRMNLLQTGASRSDFDQGRLLVGGTLHSSNQVVEECKPAAEKQVKDESVVSTSPKQVVSPQLFERLGSRLRKASDPYVDVSDMVPRDEVEPKASKRARKRSYQPVSESFPRRVSLSRMFSS